MPKRSLEPNDQTAGDQQPDEKDVDDKSIPAENDDSEEEDEVDDDDDEVVEEEEDMDQVSSCDCTSVTLTRSLNSRVGNRSGL